MPTIEKASKVNDANGNMVLRGDQTISWNADNMPAAIAGLDDLTTFVYDGDGGRVIKTENGETTVYVNSYYELDLTTGNATAYYYLGARLVAFKAGANLRFVHQDHLTGTSLTTDASGALVARVKYYPYGETRSSSGALGTDRMFTGQRLDDTGLYFYNARYYDPVLGRFISADALAQAAFNPSNLNRYTYCTNNPLKYIDPTGHKEGPAGPNGETYDCSEGWSYFWDFNGVPCWYSLNNGVPGDLIGTPGGYLVWGPTGNAIYITPEKAHHDLIAACHGLPSDYDLYRERIGGGSVEMGAYAFAAFSSIGHSALDYAGFLFDPADAINGAWYAAEGDYVNAGLSAFSIIPLIGAFGPFGKWAKNLFKLGNKGDEIIDYGIRQLGRKSTAGAATRSHLPGTLAERLAVQEAASSPASARQIFDHIDDPTWSEAGWAKYQWIHTTLGDDKINVHFLYNELTHEFDDFKIMDY